MGDWTQAKKHYRAWVERYDALPSVPRDLCVTVFFLCCAYSTSAVLLGHTGAENNSALVFVLAVVMICLLTNGYFWGILASIIGAFFTNMYFMAPYAEFSLSQKGYPVATLSMMTISCVVCALTARVKGQKAEAIRREQNTKRLYELNERLNREKNQAQLQSERESIRGNILRAVSHDLRTPLTTISGSVSVLLASPETTRTNIPLLRDIKNEADDMIIMVENLLSVTRIQDGQLPVKKREELLEEVVGDALMTTHRRFPEVKIEMEASEDILFLPIEPVLVKQVVVNLLENSIRHSGDRENIRLRLFRQENWAVVEVLDRGCGLSEPIIRAIEQERTIHRDLTGDSTRGMGIGLSVCQSIIKAHEGFFRGENRPDGGAVFRFGLPMTEKGEDMNYG